MKNAESTILVFKNRALGDAIISLGAVQYLKKNMPQANVVFGVPSWVYPLFKNLNTQADQVIAIDLKKFTGWLDLYQEVKSLKPNLILELFQSGRGKKFGNIISFFNKQIKYCGNNHHLDDGTFKKSNIQRDLDGIRNHLPEFEVGDYLDFCPKLELRNSVKKEKSIIFGIVATRETKLWPIKNYYELAKLISTNYPGVRVKIPVSVNELDQRLKTEFLSFGDSSNVDFIQTSLEMLPIEIAKAKYYIGNDTGIKHLAIALGLPSTSFFGPEPPVEWHPYDQSIHPYYYIDHLECRTREAHFCGLAKCDSMICLNQITAGQVFSDMETKLAQYFQ